MADYSYEYAKFPAQGYIEQDNFTNIPDNMATVVSEIQSYLAAGNMEQAKNLIDQNPAIAKALITSETFNKIIEEVRNTQLYSLKAKQQILFTDDSNTPPDAIADGDVWIGTVKAS